MPIDRSALELTVSLDGIKPEIWRRIVVPTSLTLRELHAVIQGAMGWQDYHLHLFEIGGRRFEAPDEESLDDDVEDEGTAILNSVLVKVRRFRYTYDFGDNWHHSVQVGKRALGSARNPLFCLDGMGACPPEDCGGSYSYPEFLAALTDEEHPEHLETVEWARGFRPDHFNVTQANALIMATCALYYERNCGFDWLFRPYR